VEKRALAVLNPPPLTRSGEILQEKQPTEHTEYTEKRINGKILFCVLRVFRGPHFFIRIRDFVLRISLEEGFGILLATHGDEARLPCMRAVAVE
jgi:hypothetical protein